MNEMNETDQEKVEEDIKTKIFRTHQEVDPMIVIKIEIEKGIVDVNVNENEIENVIIIIIIIIMEGIIEIAEKEVMSQIEEEEIVVQKEIQDTKRIID